MTKEEITKDLVIYHLKEKLNTACNRMSLSNEQPIYEKAIELLSDQYWHTEKPVDEADYLIIEKESKCKRVGTFRDGVIEDCQGRPYNYVAWHKIPPFEEEE